MTWNIRPLAAATFADLVVSLLGYRTVAQQASATAPLPVWAYPVLAPEAAKTDARSPHVTDPDADKQMHVPGSTATYTKKEIPDLFTVPDWFPQSHPPMPDVVRNGRKPDTPSCGHCHLPNGFGRPENESIAGLPKAYILQQFEDFKSGARHSSEPRMGSSNWMTRVAKSATPEEIEASAEYFASIKPTRWIRVVEAETVPKTHVADLVLVKDEPASTESIGNRIIELPENLEQTQLRNPTSGFVAYVPNGSLKRGEALVKTGGNGKTMACTTCHGADLKGVGNIPSIAGRSPSQMARQLIDFQRGNRNGAGAAMMKMPVAKLTGADIVAITGYLASLEP
jgi:cytochrome c553